MKDLSRVKVEVLAVPGVMTTVCIIVCCECRKPYRVTGFRGRTVELRAIGDGWKKGWGLWVCPECPIPLAMPKRKEPE